MELSQCIIQKLIVARTLLGGNEGSMIEIIISDIKTLEEEHRRKVGEQINEVRKYHNDYWVGIMLGTPKFFSLDEGKTIQKIAAQEIDRSEVPNTDAVMYVYDETKKK